ncbi:YdeI/OmpD-associated family protein [Mucilaginibacter defluvii]|uniref:YdhG-like domain-containing protein n=1 Tax=Mucilaginibacter defluvii TaxID=1196019 RepID=A0ABP9FYT8_9SPHI
MPTYDPRIDAYIDKAADFAKPILMHLRDLAHRTVPEIAETTKWSMPFFECNGPVCYIAAFKNHCAFGFWKSSRLSDPHKVLHEEEGSGAGSFGKITRLADLPADEILIEYIAEMVAINAQEQEEKKPTVKKPVISKTSAPVETPAYFMQLLTQNPQAMAVFEKFSPSSKKEYISWFTEAKTEATLQKRLEQAMEWISEGKQRNWKYQK